MSTHYHTVLTIAGSDSSGGAGIQADIKSICANGGYAASVITATTAQNTQKVTDIHAIPLPHLKAQLEAVLSDISFDAIKIGMLHSDKIIKAVEESLIKYPAPYIILDPVMIASSGDALMSDNAIENLKAFLPKVTLITPNIPEAELLLGHTITLKSMESSAKELAFNYHTSVLLKGGHLDFTETITDVLYDYQNKETTIIQNQAIPSINTHGTGCTLSSGIATHLARGENLKNAVIKSCAYLNKAIETGKKKRLGKGHGPVNHFGV
ncbi:Hydroxymethylpyrimidine phosphate kinase ThiD [hydrothermal vent metagenome]|uniref:Hydroxymethylpyrimidine phosphate kinase ThiD n=1 Tax=hydrothermal vent metagenome TaxID=652676 RepID=A0A1W1CM32_9ZZZZ